MNLIEPTIDDRSFLIQLYDIQQEFGNEIPWLKKINDVQYMINTDTFKEKLIESLYLPSGEQVDSFVLTSNKDEYIGGLRSFSTSPEKFHDSSLELLRKDLDASEYGYITCLQIRNVMRGSNIGRELFRESLRKILERLIKFGE